MTDLSKKQIVKRNLLLVEGHEDNLFFEALLVHMGINDIQVLPIAGKKNLGSTLKMLVLDSRFSDVVSLGIVRDADGNPEGAFQSICTALERNDLTVPERPLVPAGHGPQVIVIILPDTNSRGMLEDVCLRAVVEDPAMPCLEGFFRCLEERSAPMPRNNSKARVQVFLGSREDPGKRLGEAAQAGYWPWDHAAFEQIKDFLRKIIAPRNTNQPTEL